MEVVAHKRPGQGVPVDIHVLVVLLEEILIVSFIEKYEFSIIATIVYVVAVVWEEGRAFVNISSHRFTI